MSTLRQNVGLQSLRGIAALVVLIHHASYFYPMPYQARVIFDTVVNAHAAIIFFFVLSGFVLANSVIRFGSATSFYIKRAFRIFPAFWVTTAICVVYLSIFGTVPGSNLLNWPRDMIMEPSWTPKMVLLCLGGLPFLMGSAYTIFAEILGSAAIPPLLYLFRKAAVFRVVSIVALAVLSFYLYDAPDARRYLMFLVHFALGIFAALTYRRAAGLKIRALLIGLCVFGLIFSRQIVMIAYTGAPQQLDYQYHFPASSLFEGVFSAALIMAIALEKRAALNNSLFAWIGNISYGIYLLHLPALFVSARLAGLTGIETVGLQFAVMIALTLVITITAAELMYRFVERPCITLGERLALRKFAWMRTQDERVAHPVE